MMRIYKTFPLTLCSSLLILQGCTSVTAPAPQRTLTIQSSAQDQATQPQAVSNPSSTPAPRASSRPRSTRNLNPQVTRVSPPAPLQQAEDEEPLALSFVDADLEQVVHTLARFTKRNFLIDPRVKGQLTLVSEVPVSPRDAYSMLLNALRLQGFAVVHSNGVSKVIPESEAKLHASAVSYTPLELSQLAGEIVTQVFTLQYEKANDLVNVLRPMISPNNPITAYANNNTLVITDYADNIARVADVIARIDTAHSLNTELITIEHGVALDVAALAKQLLDDDNQDPYARTQIVADPRTNAIIIRASSSTRLEMAKELIYKIDSPHAQPNNLHVVYLKNAQATQLAQVLKGALEGLNPQSQHNSSTSQETINQPAASSNQATSNQGVSDLAQSVLSTDNPAGTVSISAGGATIQADPSTNTLIISAPPPLYRSIREVIDLLDQRRAQVLVESLIVEVNADNATEFGIQWMAGANNLGQGGNGFIGGANLGGSGVSNSVQGATTLDALGKGLSLGVVKGTVNVLGTEIINLGVLARALETKGGANILSTPNLLTLDNEEASIIVGETVPFVTGQYTTSGDGASNPFQTIEREDVGLTLRIKPQISEGGTVKLALYQEVSSLNPNVSNGAAGLVTRKRALRTNVLVDDGQIIVLGGLLEDRAQDGVSSVPLLGDIPVLGNLFRYNTQRRAKTNLMIFLRPHIVRNSQDSRRLTLDRYNYMQSIQNQLPVIDNWFGPKDSGPALPEIKSLQEPAMDLRSSS